MILQNMLGIPSRAFDVHFSDTYLNYSYDYLYFGLSVRLVRVGEW